MIRAGTRPVTKDKHEKNGRFFAARRTRADRNTHVLPAQIFLKPFNLI